jgi:hypothetical protein
MDFILISLILPGCPTLVLEWHSLAGRLGATGEHLCGFFFNCQYANCDSNLAFNFPNQVHMFVVCNIPTTHQPLTVLVQSSY